MWYDTIIIIKVDQKLSDFFHSQTFDKVKKRLWPSPLLKLKACFSRQVDVVPPQPVAAKVTVLYVAVHLNLRSVVSYFTTLNYSLIVIKIWENWSSALEEVQTVIDSRSKHEFLAKKGLGRVGRSTFFLGADQRLSGEGVFTAFIIAPWDSGPRAPAYTCARDLVF